MIFWPVYFDIETALLYPYSKPYVLLVVSFITNRESTRSLLFIKQQSESLYWPSLDPTSLLQTRKKQLSVENLECQAGFAGYSPFAECKGFQILSPYVSHCTKMWI